MSLDEREYTNRNSGDTSPAHKRDNKSNNSGYVDVETFIQTSYAKAAKERDAGFFSKIKNKLFGLFR